MIKRICQYCKKKFDVRLIIFKRGGGKYCSRLCTNMAYRGENHPRYNKIERVCKTCGKIFMAQPCRVKRNKGNYCSRKCSEDYHRPVERICKNCGKKFKLLQCRLRVGGGNYCSKECQCIYWKITGIMKGKNNPKYNQIDVKCKNCGKIFTKKPSNIGGKYCSAKCLIIAKGSVDYHCETCDKTFRRRKSEIKKGKHIYCDISCMSKAFSEFEKYKGKTGKNGNAWKGGYFPYYGENWLEVKRKVLKRANYKSEMSKMDGEKLHVHHIISLREIINKYMELCLVNYIPDINIISLQVLPYDIIPNIFFEEANSSDNLIVLMDKEHREYEGMPIGFFNEIKRGSKLPQ